MPTYPPLRVRSAQPNVCDFERTRLKRTDVVPVLFAASWCPFCLMFKPVFKATLREKGIKFATVNLSDLENPFWETFDIGIVPTVVGFIDGRPAIRRMAFQAGVCPRRVWTISFSKSVSVRYPTRDSHVFASL